MNRMSEMERKVTKFGNSLGITMTDALKQIGVKDPELLESAVLRPKSSALGEDTYPTTFEKAAALFESLGQNHPFYNANKRTAFTALVIFLRYNGLHFKMDTKKAENFTVDMVNHKYEFRELATVVQTHCVKINEA